MAAIATNEDIPYKTRLNLALQAIQSSQVRSIRAAAALYNIPRTTLQDQLHGGGTRHDAQVNNRKLTPTEEQALLDRIISLDERGLSPTLPLVRQMADLLLSQREPLSSVGENWVTRFVQRHEELMSKYLRKYDYQRAKCNDPEIINNWFKLVQATIAKYGIVMEDIYNFDETGFQMGVIATAKVITQTKRSTSTQPRSARTTSGRALARLPAARWCGANREWLVRSRGAGWP